jgi:GntR family transcriptional regulator, transcriptional repressor for pyruvate dehydrogenase complex
VTAKVPSTRLRNKPERVADELRNLIVSSDLSDGESLGSQLDLVARFSVSRPSLREALRILEAEGLVTVMQGVLGRVVVHKPNERITARSAALVLQSRNATLRDVHEASNLIELAVVRTLAATSSPATIRTLLESVAAGREVVHDRIAFSNANEKFHVHLIRLSGNQTLGMLAETLKEIVARAVVVGQVNPKVNSLASRERTLRSQERLIELLQRGLVGDAEAHWDAHIRMAGPMSGFQGAELATGLCDYCEGVRAAT